MSRSAEIKLPFGGQERVFRLGIAEWERIQEDTDAGPPELLQRLAPMVQGVREGLKFADMVRAGLLGRWRIGDPRSILYWGLRGGGMDDAPATLAVRAAYDSRLSFEHVLTAFLVAEASWTPPPDEAEVGKAKSGERKGRKSRPSRTANSALPTSTAPEL